MRNRTISIDVDAYSRLANARREGESFGDTLKRVIWDPIPFQAVLKQLEADPLSDEAIDAVEQVVAGRRRSVQRRRDR
jgi:predicted CopG family antitoxin